MMVSSGYCKYSFITCLISANNGGKQLHIMMQSTVLVLFYIYFLHCPITFLDNIYSLLRANHSFPLYCIVCF